MEKFDDLFGDLSGYKILSFEEVSKGFEGNKNPLKGIASKSFEEISREKWAKIRGEDITEVAILDGFFEDEITNIRLLIDDMKSSDYFMVNKFDSGRYTNHKKILTQFKKDSGLPSIAEKDNLKIRENNYLLEVKPEKIDSKELQKISDDLFFDTLKKHITLNTSIDYINKKEYTHNIIINTDTDKKSVLYEFHIYYSQVKFTDTSQHPTSTETVVNTDDKYKAIVLRTESYQTFMKFIERIYGAESYRKYQYILFERFEKLATEINTIEELKFFYDIIPDFILKGFKRNGKTIKLSDNILWTHFMQFIDYDDSLSLEDKKNGAMWSLPTQNFRDESSYAIRILSGISGDFILGKLLSNPELVLRIYSNLDGQSEYKGKAFLINGISNSYGSWIDNKTIFVSIITAHLQNYEQDSRVQFTQNKETDFFQGTDLVDEDTNYQIEYALDSHIFFKEAGKHKNTIYLKNEMREWIPYGTMDTNRGNETVGEWTEWTALADTYYNPLEMVTFSQYIDRKDLEGNLSEDCIISNVPALFVKHASDLKEWQKVHQMLRIGADILMIVGSIAAIESGASGLILYAALADLGLATADIGIQSIKPDLQKSAEGIEFLEQWELLYTVGTTVTIGPVVLKAIVKKLPQILEKAIPLFHTNKLWGKTYEAFSNIVLKSVYSLRINGFTKSGLQLIKKGERIKELGSLANKVFRLQEANVLFVKNASLEAQIAVIYKGKVIASGLGIKVAKVLEKPLTKLTGRKLIAYLDELVELTTVVQIERPYLYALEEILTNGQKLGKWTSIQEETMIKLYTGGVYERLNNALRGLGAKLSPDLVVVKKWLDRALNNLPKSEYNKGILLRSMYMDEPTINKLFPKNGVYIEKGFFSTTHSEEALKGWMTQNSHHNVLFKVYGRNGKLIEEVSQKPLEHELLFRSGTSFDVMKLDIIDHPYINGELVYEIILKEK